MHWHGVNQLGTPWFDGVPTVSQCPIIPGSDLTYRFRADEYGTSWWHSHLSAQYTQGVFGPLVIHGPNHVDYDEDLGVIMANDWYHAYHTDIVANTTAPVPPGQPFRPLANSNLVGGVGRFPCENVTNGAPCTTVPYASWKVEPGKTYRARFVNAGSSSFESISIDNHSMTVIANDFIPIQPYQADFVKLAVGQRADVIFNATGSAGDAFWIRAFNDPGCADTLPAAAEGKAILSYPDADTSIEPNSLGLPVPANPSCGNDGLSLTIPIFPVPVAEPDLTITVTIAPSQVIDPATGLGPVLWTLDNSTFIGDMSDPLLLSAITSDTTTFPSSSNVYNTGSATTVRIILINVFLAPHPIHIHGHDFQVLAQGQGIWDGEIINPSNPQRRDVQMMWFGANATDPAVGPNYLVVQYEADNPGMWNFHCHIAWHLSAGMNMVLLERPDELVQMDGSLPEGVRETCIKYNAWSGPGKEV